jgi:hypothetical protein
MAVKKTFEFFFGPLLKKFFQDMGRDPNNLEMIILRQKAGQLLKDSNKVIQFPQKRSFAEEIELMKRSGDIVDVDDIKISEKITDREMFKNSNLNKPTIEGQMEKITGASNKIKQIQKEQADMYKPKSDAEIAAKYDKENKESIQRFKDKMKKDEPDDMATGGRAGYGLGSIIKKRAPQDVNVNQNQNMSGVDSRMSLDYDTLVEQNVDKRLQDSNFLNNIKDQDPALRERELNPPTTMPVSPLLPVEPRNQPSSLEEYLSGYEEYKAKNPNTYAGTQALIPTTLPGGFNYTFRSGPHANHFNDYLRSIGLSPYEKYADESMADESMIEKFNQGGRAGYYTGGITDVEPSLDDIGHGAEAMNSRTRLMSPGNQATTSTGLNYLLAEDNDNMRIPFSAGGGLTPEDYLKVKDMLNHYHDYKKSGKPRISKADFAKAFFRENNAEGGRIGFSAGGDAGRRAFLKLLATLTGGAAAFKTGILGLGEGTAKKAITETVKQSAGTGTPPPYFFKLVEKIKTMGDDVTPKYATKDREIVKQYKDFELTEDIATGEQTIQRKKPSDFEYYDEQLYEDVYMNYKPGKGQADEGAPKVADEYVEDTSYIRTSGPQKGDVYDTVDGVPDDVIQEGTMFEDNMTEFGKTKKADGGRIGFSAGSLARLGITGSSRKFLEKVFGKEKFKNMIENDPELHRGMLEVVEMFRSKDKTGLVEYMQNFLPQMSKKELEAFVVGSGDTAGIEGQLIRLGSGRDYKNKIDMIEESNNLRKLKDFDVEGVSKNAEGGRIGFSGGGIFRAIIAKAAAKQGLKPYEFIKVTSYKSLPPEVKMFLSADDFAKLKSGQQDMYSNYIDMAKTRKNFQEQVEGGKTTPARELFEGMEKTMDEQSYVPKTVTDKDIAEMELNG